MADSSTYLQPDKSVVNHESAKGEIGKLDVGMAVSVGICLVLAHFVPSFQPMTACIATHLCLQENVKVSWKAGRTRMVITAIGGTAGIAVVILDESLGNQWLFIAFSMVGIVLTLAGCKLARVPRFSGRTGAVTFVLVARPRFGFEQINHAERVTYAIFRLLLHFLWSGGGCCRDCGFRAGGEVEIRHRFEGERRTV
jgi:hypothetical protein